MNSMKKKTKTKKTTKGKAEYFVCVEDDYCGCAVTLEEAKKEVEDLLAEGSFDSEDIIVTKIAFTAKQSGVELVPVS